jgi:CheY-like chemotaxis protein
MPEKVLKILAADDTEMNIDLLRRFIQRQGHELITAGNGREAVAQFEAQRPDMVFMDVMMPEMDGYEATRRIREISGDAWVPIIFMSAKVATDDQVQGLEAGGDDYLTKPINLKILSAKIKAMQRIAELQQAMEEQAAELKVYRDKAEDEKQLATKLMERITRSSALVDDLLQSWSLSAEHMSGDLVAATRTQDERLYVMVADATGHGLPAALVQMPVSQVFYDMARAGYTVGSIVTTMNRQLRALVPRDRFVAATIISLDVRNRTVEMWNGGNPEAMFVDKTGRILRRFTPKAAPLGIVGVDDFESYTEVYQWPEEGELLLYSDGVIDADAPDGEPFGEQRLEAAVTAKGQASACEAVTQALQQHLDGRRGQDDISVVCVRCPV